MIINATSYKNGNKTTYLLYDLHADYSNKEITKKQIELLQTLAQEHNPAFIIEDMFDWQSDDKTVQDIIAEVNQRLEQGALLFAGTDIVEYSPLFGLAQRLSKENHRVINVEFRQQFLLNNWYAARGRIAEAVTAFTLLTKAFEEMLTEIRSYDDNEILNSYYQQVVTQSAESLSYIQENTHKVLSTSQEKSRFLTHLWHCMLHVIEARMVHAWYQQTLNNDVVVVYAGGEHVKVLEGLIGKLGYSKVAQCGEPSMMDHCTRYRNKINSLQMNNQSGLWPIIKNIIANIRSQRLVAANIKKHQEVLTAAGKIDLASLLKR